jgi:hypothetical protein
MKKISFLFIAIIFSIATYSENKKNIKLGKPILLKGEKGYIKNNDDNRYGFSYPVVYDWNQDGKKDLIVGMYSAKAKIKIYLNKGTNAKPQFSGEYFYGKGMDGKPLFIESC